MNKIVGVSLYDNDSITYFNPGDFELKRNVEVVVQTEKGTEYGSVVIPTIELEKKPKQNYNKILRIASEKDTTQHSNNLKDSKEALNSCKKIAKELNLNMQIIDAHFTFDRSQLVFKFLADGRVDFRELAKELANKYRTRIELRQIGVRDKAKAVGGCGMCGRQLCCSRFSDDFSAVSINMAKNQNIALNPNKINGVCGRLLCCLRYEDEIYKENRRCLPKINTTVDIKGNKGKVIEVDVVNQKYKVELTDGTVIVEDGNN